MYPLHTSEDVLHQNTYIVSSSDSLRNSEHLFLEAVIFIPKKTERKMIMWCEELSNGKVKYWERYKNPITRKSSKVSITMEKDTNANRKRALIALQGKIEEKLKDLSTPVKKEDLTLFSLAEAYIEAQSLAVTDNTLKKSTLRRNIFAIKKIVDYLGGESIVDNLNAVYVKKHLYVGANKSCTKNERLKRFKAMMRWGYSEEMIKDVAWINKLKPFQDKEKKKKLEDKFLESHELKLLLSTMTITKWCFLTEFTALSGMRIGEVLALEDSDLDFDNKIISITKNYDYLNDIVGTPKNEDSIREIYMQDQLYDLCKRIKRYMARERMQCRYRTKLFMSDDNGNHLDYFAFNKYLKEKTFATVKKKATTHFLRHTHVALMAEQEVPLDVISRRLGHADSKITREIYFHVTKKLKQKDYNRIKNVQII